MPSGSKTEYSYDAMQRLTQVQSLKADATTNLAKFDYGYNTRDVRTFVEKTIGGATTQKVNYTYDNIDQLTKELSTEVNPTLDKEYSYDAMGNRISSAIGAASTAYTSNNLNQITQTTVNNTNTAITYDANGNTVAIGAKTFGYNDADQLTSVVIPNTKKSEFVYDSDGRKRISKEFAWQNGAWVQSDETRFVYDGMDLVQERSADGTVKASYVRDGNIGGVLSRTTPDGTFYYHYDGGGNVVALTDANENIVAQYSYDAFGNTLSATGAQAEKNPFRFSSKYYDGDTGLYDYGLRHYDSSLGRWINRDPISEEGGLNLYGMVGNNPVSNVDPRGLAIVEIHGRRVVATGAHAFVLVWETDKKGNKVGTPWFFGGYSTSRQEGEDDNRLHTDYGPYRNRKGTKLDRDYWYQPGHYDYFGLIWSMKDNKSAASHRKRFMQVADKIENACINYQPLGTNSNASARTIVEYGLGLEIGGPDTDYLFDDYPGWDRALLSGNWWTRFD